MKTLLILITISFILDQDPIEQLLDSGYEKYENEQYEEAILVFTEAAKIDSSNAETFYLRGLSYHGAEKIRESIIDLKKAVSINPQYTEAYQQMGFVYLISQAPEEAIEAFDNALSLNDKIAEVYQTEAYPSHPIAVSPTMSQEDCAKIVQALLDMPAELKSLLSIKQMIGTNDEEYAVIRELSEKLDIVARD